MGGCPYIKTKNDINVQTVTLPCGTPRKGGFFLHNLLKDKTAMEKLWLVLKCVPLFSLNTFFRVGSAVPKVDKVFTFKSPFLSR